MPMSRAGKKRIVLGAAIVAAAGLAAGVYAARQAQLRRDMDHWLSEGIAAHDRGDFQAALDNLNAFVSRDKTNAQALIDFANARRRIALDNNEHIRQAISITQLALQISPDSAIARRMLMELYREIGQWPEAKEAAERVLELEPANLDAHGVRIDAATVVGDKQGMIAAAKRMADAAPDNLDCQRNAFDAMRAADADPAALSAFVDRTAAKYPKSLGVQLMRIGLTAAQAKDVTPGSAKAKEFDKTLRDQLTAAASIAPRSPDEARTLLSYLDLTGPELQALANQTLERLMNDPQTAATLAAFAASRRWAAGDFGEAGQIVLRSAGDLASAEDDAVGWLALSGLPEAQAAVAELKKRESAAAHEWLALATAAKQLEEGDALHAAEGLGATTQSFPQTHLVALYLTGVAREALGESAQAAQFWKQLLDEAPAWDVARDQLVAAYLRLGRLEDAGGALFDRGIVGSGRYALEVTTKLDEQSISIPGIPPASQIADALINASGDDPNTRIWAARAYLADGQADKAMPLVDALLAADLGESQFEAVELAARLEPVDPARAASLAAKIRTGAKSALDLYHLAGLMLRDGKADEARAMLADAAASAPEGEKPTWKLIQALFLDDLGDPTAAPALLEASAAMPDNISVQQAVLSANSVWVDPRPLDEVIARLRAITGDKAAQWRVYRNKRELALLDPSAADTVQRANGIVLDLAAVIKADPTNVAALRVSAEASALAGDTARAADTMLKATRAVPNDLEIAIATVRALKLDGRLAEARRNARDLAQLDAPTGLLRKARAEALERFGFPDLAAADWKALSGDHNPGATTRLAISLLKSGQTDQGDALIQQLQAMPSLPDGVLRDIAAYQATRGQLDEGLKTLARLPETGSLGDRDTIVAQFLASQAAGIDDARALEQRFAASKLGGVWAAIAQAYLRAGETADARRVTEIGVKADPGSPDLATYTAMFRASDAQDPMALLAMVRSTMVYNPTPEAEAAGAAVDQRLAGQIDNDALLARLRQINASAPTSIAVWQLLATLYEVIGDTDSVRTTLFKAMDALSFDPAIARVATYYFARAGMENDALIAARNWRERSANPDFGADQALAALLVRKDQGAEAVGFLRPWRDRIIANRDRFPSDAQILARAMLQSGDLQGAEAAIGPFAEAPGQPVALYIAACGDIDDAKSRRDWLTRAESAARTETGAERLSQLAGAWYALVLATHEPGDTAQAVRLADEALQRDDADKVGLRVTQAGAYEAAKDWSHAKAAYAALLELIPSNPDVHNNYATVILAAKGDANEALSHARTARELAQAAGLPADRTRSYIDTEAQSLLAAGQPDEAAKVYQSILESNPRWNYALVGLTEALVASHRQDEAKAVLARLGNAPLSDDLAPRVEAVRVSLGE